MKRLKGIVLVALALTLTVLSVPPESASAQSSALSIAPRKDYVIESGKTINDKLTIRNIDRANDLNLYLQVVDFTYQDDSGTPKLLLNGDAEPTPWSLKKFITIPEMVNVKAGGSASVDFKIKVPSQVGAGGYYSAIVYSTSAPSGGNLGLAASGVTLAFVNVPGQMNEDLKIQKFGSYDSKTKSYRYLNFSEPMNMAYTVVNNGNVFEAPAGTITLKSMFGQTYNIDNINTNKSLALIKQERTFQACIKTAAQKVDFQGSSAEANSCVGAGLWPGLYTASIDLFYGQNGNTTKEITKIAYFWYLPLWFIVIVVIVALALAFYIWRLVVMLRGGSFKIGGRPRTSKRRQRRH